MKIIQTTIQIIETDDRYVATATWFQGDKPNTFYVESLKVAGAPADVLGNLIESVAELQYNNQQEQT